MNDTDRQEIASILEAITSDDTIVIINTANSLFRRHPKIVDWLSPRAREWWGLPLEGQENE